jgi:hypothetical protein
MDRRRVRFRQGDRLEHAAVLAGREARAAPEQPPEEARVLVAQLGTDLVERRVPSLEQALGFLDPQVIPGARGISSVRNCRADLTRPVQLLK